MIHSYQLLSVPEKEFTLKEVSTHNSAESCWLAIGTNVYDVTKFLAFHPAGRNVLLQYAGQDVTKLYLQFHSENILHKYHDKFCIGRLSGKDVPKPPIATISEQETFGELVPYGEPAWNQGYKSPFYNETHLLLRKKCREFLLEKIAPYADEWDANKKIPLSMMKDMGEKGAFAVLVGQPWPKQYFPLDEIYGVSVDKIDYFHEIICIEECAKYSGIGLLWAVGTVSIGLPPIIKNGSEELKDKYVTKVLKGEKIIALAVTEPWAGSDVAGIKTTATLTEDGKHYIVNGMKKFITSGAYADLYSVAVRTDEDKYFGVSMLVIEANMPGVKRRQMNMQGVWGSGTGFIIFDNVKVPVENLVGDEGCAFLYIMQNFNHERFQIIAECAAASRLMVEECLKYTHLRQAFGKRLIDQPVIRYKLAQMIKEVESLQAYLEIVAYNFKLMDERQEKVIASAIGIAKAHSTVVLEQVCRDAIQIVGGVGYQRGSVVSKIERYYRDVKSLVLGGGSPEVMFDMSVRMVGGLMPKQKPQPKI